MKFRRITIIFLILFASCRIFAQTSEFLGIRLRSEIQAIVKEVETKSGKEIYTEFTEHKDYQFGLSFISDEGTPVVLIDYNLANDPKKLEAVIAHELLHLRLRVNNYPTFLFSPRVQTAKGRAVDVEQSNINDLLSIIEHRIFKSEMERFGLQKILNLAGDTARLAKAKKGIADGQDDSINYARAILEYPNQKDVDEVSLIYRANNWARSFDTGKAIAEYISRSNLQTPAGVEAVFLKCIVKLYEPPQTHTFKLTVDPKNKFFRRMIISTARRSANRRK